MLQSSSLILFNGKKKENRKYSEKEQNEVIQLIYSGAKNEIYIYKERNYIISIMAI